MRNEIDILKGTHPGVIIGGELRKRKLRQKAFADSIGIHLQALNAVINGRRNLTTEMALKIEKALGYKEGYLLTFQIYYDIAEYKNRIAEASVNDTSLSVSYK